MPHITAHLYALWPATKPQSCNCPRNPATDSRAAKHHARAPHAMLARALLCLASARLGTLCLCASCSRASAPRAHAPLGLTPVRPLCPMPARPLRLNLASCCVRHPHSSCAHATVCALLPRPSQRASPALFLCSPQAHPYAAKTRHKAPSQATAVGPHDSRCRCLFITSIMSNTNAPTVKKDGPGRLASVYSELQTSRLNVSLPLPSVLKKTFNVVDGAPSSASGNPEEIKKLFPKLFGQPSARLVECDPKACSMENKSLKIGVVLSGGQAPGGHNVISGIFDYLQERTNGSKLYGFKGGPAGIMKCKYVELSTEYIYPYRNQGGFDMICSGRDKIETPEQFKQAEETAKKLDLDGLVVIGGDDSNTNACLLAENFRSKDIKTRVIGCPKTIDGDLKCKEVPTSFGFDTACKIFSEMIGNVMTDARSTGKYYHFVRLMGRAASHITLECALQTHPNITIIGEEVAAKKQTLKIVTDYITDIICKRSEAGYNYGVILIPEGLIDFIPEVQQLIAELNEILAHDGVDQDGAWKKKLKSQSQELFELFPKAIQEQLLLERDPHGNVQVAKIETEKMLIQMVETELNKMKQKGAYKGQFNGQSHFFGYEGRCGLPTNFDANYCYALGYAAAALLHAGKTGLISSVGNLGEPVEEWTVGGTALTSLMDVERRHGKFKPVIKKAMVELEGIPFKTFASLREDWTIKNLYVSPGPIQFVGPNANDINHTLKLELGPPAQAKLNK
ncbi:Pyrophosphate--fructose 6-phosphate 1-phosphotransferase subunit beta 1 [Citrus sinensis]|uniref:Pyrophosphate--fructose 6-phosphate 1-phosphotransferase subunit beta 1 n=2 Tax=Citrus sinensis TaxID=2711 RepID=A0ACB8N720_CITSI|nr:Pyrophosphate--fructose 6-phosphate 1-phosphotransferase subunit beta 1 [Citrus sinensis]